MNSRLDELQAAILRVKLRHLDRDNATRTRLAATYTSGLAGAGFQLPGTRAGATHVYHLYVVRSPHRDELLAFLRSRGISALIHYAVPIHLQPAYQDRLLGRERLPQTERAAREILSLPMYPELSEVDLNTVVQAVAAFGGRT